MWWYRRHKQVTGMSTPAALSAETQARWDAYWEQYRAWLRLWGRDDTPEAYHRWIREVTREHEGGA